MNKRLAIIFPAILVIFALPNSGQASIHLEHSFTRSDESISQAKNLLAAPEMDVRWYDNGFSIADGDTNPSTTDGTDFGSANVIGERVIHSFQIHNTGDANLNLTGNPKVEFSGCNGFSAFSQPGSPAIPGGHRTFSVEFNPSTSGVCTATLSIANDDADENPYNFTIQGTGTEATGPEMDVRYINGRSIADEDTTPTYIDGTDFGHAYVSGSSIIHNFQIHNTGDAILNLTGNPKVVLSGCNGFSVFLQPGTPIIPGGNMTISVEFHPSSYGVCTATLSIANDDADENPYNFTIQGTGLHTGPDMDVRWSENGVSISNDDYTPSPIDGTDFGSALVSSGSVIHNFEIHNTGDTDLILTGNPIVELSGCNGFSVSSQPGTPVVPGSHSTFSVEFNPSSIGLCVADLTIDHADDEVPYVFTIQGTGTSPTEPICYTLTLNRNGSGSVPSATPANSTGCPSGNYVAKETIDLEAKPSSGWRVHSWEGTDDDSNTSTINSLSMPAKSHTVIVNYFSYSSDITITHLEINQATQDENNSIKLVANKNTGVRVHISTNVELNGVTGLLKVINGPNQVPGSPFQPVNNAEGKITVYKNPKPEKNADHTLNFRVPGESLDPGTYIFQVELIFNGETLDTFEIKRPLIKKGTINILYYPIRVQGKGLPSHSSMISSYHFIRQTFPVGNNSVQLIPGGSTLEWPYSYISSFQFSAILTRLSVRLLRHNLSTSSLKADYVAGFAPIDSMDYAGVMNPIVGLTGKSVLVEDKEFPGNVSSTLAHEIGHYFGFGDEYDGAPFWAYKCNINPPSDNVNSPCNQNDPGNQFGTFISTKAFDVDRMIPAAYVYVPNVGMDNPFRRINFMGGIWLPDLHDHWVTDRVYEHLLVHQDLDPKTNQKNSISASQYLVLSGTINKDDTVDLDPFYIVSGSNTSSSFVGDGYSFELLDNSDLLLASYTFSVSFKLNSNPPIETDSAPFSFVVPYPLGTTKIQIKHDDTIISTVLASDNSPSVTVLSPNGGEVLSGVHEIKWTSFDLDGDNLSYTIEYSPNGSDWFVIAADLTSSQFYWDTSHSPGGFNARIRVIASDGINTSHDESDETFLVIPKDPFVSIDIPYSGYTIPPNSIVAFSGEGIDLEDGLLDEIDLIWKSNLDGHLGNGRTILTPLTQGNHLITLTGRDSDGNESNATISVFVGHKLYLPTTTK